MRTTSGNMHKMPRSHGIVTSEQQPWLMPFPSEYYGPPVNFGGSFMMPPSNILPPNCGVAPTFSEAPPLDLYLSDNDAMYVLDPAGRDTGVYSVLVPREHILETRAVHSYCNADKPPSLCMLFQNGNCRMGSQCQQVHVLPDVMEHIRGFCSTLGTCCFQHGDVHSVSVVCPMAQLAMHFTSLTLVLREGHKLKVPLTSLAWTSCLEKTLNSALASGVAVPTFSYTQVCRVHQLQRCSYGKACRHIHLCREVWKGVTRTFPSVTMPVPTSLHHPQSQLQRPQLQQNAKLGGVKQTPYNSEPLGCVSPAANQVVPWLAKPIQPPGVIPHPIDRVIPVSMPLPVSTTTAATAGDVPTPSKLVSPISLGAIPVVAPTGAEKMKHVLPSPAYSSSKEISNASFAHPVISCNPVSVRSSHSDMTAATATTSLASASASSSTCTSSKTNVVVNTTEKNERADIAPAILHSLPIPSSFASAPYVLIANSSQAIPHVITFPSAPTSSAGANKGQIQAPTEQAGVFIPFGSTPVYLAYDMNALMSNNNSTATSKGTAESSKKQPPCIIMAPLGCGNAFSNVSVVEGAKEAEISAAAEASPSESTTQTTSQNVLQDSENAAISGVTSQLFTASFLENIVLKSMGTASCAVKKDVELESSGSIPTTMSYPTLVSEVPLYNTSVDSDALFTATSILSDLSMNSNNASGFACLLPTMTTVVRNADSESVTTPTHPSECSASFDSFDEISKILGSIYHEIQKDKPTNVRSRQQSLASEPSLPGFGTWATGARGGASGDLDSIMVGEKNFGFATPKTAADEKPLNAPSPFRA